MTVSLIQTLQANLESTGREILKQVGNGIGHLWTYIQKFPDYAQDTRIAYPSLIIANLIAFQIAEMVTRCFHYFVPANDESRSDICQTAVDLATLLIGYSTVIGIVTLFVKKTQLPLPPFVMVGISAATIAVCVFHTYYRN